MSVELIALVIIGGFVLLLCLGVEIAVAMGVMASLGFVFFVNKPQVEIAWTAWTTLNSFTLLSMTFFIFMGAIFANTGVVKTLFSAADKWLGWLPGGLVSSVLGACAVFGAMSGSSVAAAATFSTITFPEMEKRGYDPKLALGAIAIGGTLSVLIPPSIILIVYGSWENQSVARLFAAAMIPGVIATLLLILTVMVMVALNRKLAPKPVPTTWSERIIAVRDILPWLLLISLILGSIFGGIMTPTEASALGGILSVVMALAYRKLTFKAFKDSFLAAVKVSAMIGFIMVAARLLSFVLQASGLTETFASFTMNLPLGKYGMFTLICIMYLILGCFLDSMSMMLLTLPFVMPVLASFNFSPIWWGVVYVILAEIGMVTPPFGLNLFTIQSVLPKYPLMTIARGSLPFIIPMLLVIVLVTIWPQLALWLPGVLY